MVKAMSNFTPSPDDIQRYQSLLETIESQLTAMIAELETNNSQYVKGKQIHTELAFDSIPLLRGLKNARKLAEESLWVYSKHKI